MTFCKGCSRNVLVGLSVSFIWVMSGIFAPAVLANGFVPSNPGRPGNRVGGGVRGCLSGVPPRLMAMIPDSNLGYTTQDYPNFYAYVPNNTSPLMEFSLFKTDATGENRQLLYRSVMPSQQTAGIVRFSLPEDVGVAPLDYGQDYQWSVALICDVNSPRAALRTLSWVQRVAPEDELVAQLANADLSQQARLYAENGFWFDALDSFVALRNENPENVDIQQRWQEFLTSVELDAIVDQSVTDARAE
ncbi:MAG: DUF928 domain-containing protein [Cyanobacteria bacterium J06635_15]